MIGEPHFKKWLLAPEGEYCQVNLWVNEWLTIIHLLAASAL